MSYEMKDYIAPDLCHEVVINSLEPKLRFKAGMDFETHKKALREKLTELLGEMPEKVPTNVQVEWTKEHEDFTETRYIFDCEKYSKCPCHLWVPKDGREKHAVVICLQGHSSGMHISMGRAKFEGDEISIGSGDRDFARQIIAQGYAALVMEQRGFGERNSSKKHGNPKTTCLHPAMVALMLGRTLLGERVWDISRAIDSLSYFTQIDTDRVAVMGNSGGGTAAYYAACMDERIKIAMPSCSVCSYKRSIAALRHCDCNYLPNAIKYFDMGDLAALIAPRKLVVVAGKEDIGFLYDGVLDSYDIIKSLYKKAGVPDNCTLVVGEEGHRFYADPAWKAFNKFNL